jgi:hypothetical protein
VCDLIRGVYDPFTFRQLVADYSSTIRPIFSEEDSRLLFAIVNPRRYFYSGAYKGGYCFRLPFVFDFPLDVDFDPGEDRRPVVPHGKTRKVSSSVLPLWYYEPLAAFSKPNRVDVDKHLANSHRPDAHNFLVHVCVAIFRSVGRVWANFFSHPTIKYIDERWRIKLFPWNCRSATHVACDTGYGIVLVPDYIHFFQIFDLRRPDKPDFFRSEHCSVEPHGAGDFFSSLFDSERMTQFCTSRLMSLLSLYTEAKESLGVLLTQAGAGPSPGGIWDAVKAKVAEYGGICNMLLIVYIVASGAYLLYASPETFISWLLGCCAMVGVSSGFLKPITDLIQSVRDAIHNQFSETKLGPINTADPFYHMSVFVTAYTVSRFVISYFMGFTPDPEVVMAHGLMELPRNFSTPQSWNSLWVLIEKIISSITNYVHKLTYGYEPGDYAPEDCKFFTDCHNTISELEKDLESFAKSHSQVDKYITQMAQLTMMASAYHNNTKMRKPITDLHGRMRPYQEKLTERGAFVGFKGSMRPATIFVEGPTRVGKSKLVNMLHKSFFKKYPSGFDSADLAVYRRTRDKFWSDYNSQPIIDFDDFGCVTDTASAPNPNYVDFLDLCSDKPVPLSMAFTKGGVYSRARLITATLNHPQKLYSMTNPEAIDSRQDLYVRVRVDAAAAEKYGFAKYLVTASNGSTTFNESTCPPRVRMFLTKFEIVRCIFKEYVGKVVTYQGFYRLFEKVIEFRMHPPKTDIESIEDFEKFLDRDWSTLGDCLEEDEPLDDKELVFEDAVEDEVLPVTAHGIYDSYLDSFSRFVAKGALYVQLGMLNAEPYKTILLQNTGAVFGCVLSSIGAVIAAVGIYRFIKLGYQWYTSAPVTNHGSRFSSSSDTSSWRSEDIYGKRAGNSLDYGEDWSFDSARVKFARGHGVPDIRTLQVTPLDDAAREKFSGPSQEVNEADKDKLDSVLKNPQVVETYTRATFGVGGRDEDGRFDIYGSGLAVGGAFFLMNKHVFTTWSRKSHHTLVNWSTSEQLVVDPRECMSEVVCQGPDFQGDAVLIALNELGNRRYITSLFVQKTDVEKLEGEVLGALPLFYDPISGIRKRPFFSFGSQMVERVKVGNQSTASYELTQTLAIPALTQFGDCGTPVCRGCGESVIIGIVSAGSTELSYVQVITRSILQDAIIRLRQNDPRTMLPEYPGNFDRLPPPRNAVVVDKVMSALGTEPITYKDRGSKFRRSSISKYLPDDSVNYRVPAKLEPFVKDGQRVYPRQAAFRKMLVEQPQIPLETRDLGYKIIDYLVPSLATKTPDRAKVLSPLLAISSDAYPCMRSIDMSTSAGFPYNLKNMTKRDLFEMDKQGHPIGLKPELMVALDKFVADVKRGYAPAIIYLDALKDELREPSKVERPRMFSIGSIVLLILTRCYYGSYFSALRANKIINGIAIGTNVFSSDWGVIFRHLTAVTPDPAKGKNFVAADFGDYDASLVHFFMTRIFSRIIDWIGDSDAGNNKIRWAIANNIIFSIHHNLDEVYGWRGSNPSGCPVTAELNSIYNVFSIHYCFHRLFGRAPLDNDIRYITYGDDELFGIRDGLLPHFDLQKWAGFSAEIGLRITGSDKKELTDFTTIDDCDFLKRKFRLVKNEIVAPLSFQTLTDMVHWTHSSNVAMELKQRVLNSIIEASLHGPAAYTAWQKKLSDAISACPSFKLQHKDQIRFNLGWSDQFDLCRSQGYDDPDDFLAVPLTC